MTSIQRKEDCKTAGREGSKALVVLSSAMVI
jgi:hypothetical protein